MKGVHLLRFSVRNSTYGGDQAKRHVSGVKCVDLSKTFHTRHQQHGSQKQNTSHPAWTLLTFHNNTRFSDMLAGFKPSELLLSIWGQSVKLTVSQPHDMSSLSFTAQMGGWGYMWPKEETWRFFPSPLTTRDHTVKCWPMQNIRMTQSNRCSEGT